MSRYVLGIDQSTQGTKALILDEKGQLICRSDLLHRQYINEKGWVEHDPNEIYQNVLKVIRDVVQKAGIDQNDLSVLGISNQRETAVAWDRESGDPVYPAIVWQCARGMEICEKIKNAGYEEKIHSHTGLRLSPYFSAAKIAWILQNVEDARKKADKGELCCGTIDSWLIYKLTCKEVFRTDYSNASRTQLFHIGDLAWDREICDLFGVPIGCLAEVTDSDGDYGMTDLEGYLDHKIPIRGVLGDSHGALFGQGCLEKGMAKATYGTGSSVMMNIGKTPVFSDRVVTSLAWKLNGEVDYVLEGNINYTGAVITWMKNDLELIASPNETSMLAQEADPADRTYLVPAFTGLGAPHWKSDASAIFTGMTRTTKRRELVKAGLDCIAYQITDIMEAMNKESGIRIKELRADGGPTKNDYLMQFQSDISQAMIQISCTEELSGIGAAYVAGIAAGIYDKKEICSQMKHILYKPQMDAPLRTKKYAGWKSAVEQVLCGSSDQFF